MNSEEFRETFLRNDREGPTKAKMAEKAAEPTLEEKRDLRLGLRKKPRRTTPRGQKELWGTSKQQKGRG